MDKVRIGVLGAYRGSSMINYCKRASNAELVAVCDKTPEALEAQRKRAAEEGYEGVTYYDNFEDFIKHDMDAVVLANYATEHAPFAIKSMKAGKHVYSECLPVQNMKEAVELIEAVEETGKIYAFGENYCYMAAPYEMKKLYEQGKLGEFEYGECEYIHNCMPIWQCLTYGERDHWRNNLYANFYCTHSIGPIIHITGLRPVSVTGFETTMNERPLSNGCKGATFGIVMITLENGGIIKAINGNLYKDSVWYSIYGSKGRMESARKDAQAQYHERIYVNCDEFQGAYGEENVETYEPVQDLAGETQGFGHGGSDFYTMYNFAEKIKGNPKADTIDVYEALDMFLPGLFAHFSVLDGGVPKEIPNLRDKAVRDLWRNNTACTDPKAAGDMLLPTMKTGTPDIPDSVYEHVKELWIAEAEKEDGNYRAKAFKQGSKDYTGGGE